jgi:hypothetical protein
LAVVVVVVRAAIRRIRFFAASPSAFLSTSNLTKNSRVALCAREIEATQYANTVVQTKVTPCLAAFESCCDGNSNVKRTTQ